MRSSEDRPTSRPGDAWSRLRLLGRRLVIATRPYVPPAARRPLKRASAAVDPIRVRLHRRRTGEARPIPPKPIRDRIGATTIASYFDAGQSWAGALEHALGRQGMALEDFDRVLDFGCGAGKVLQHFHGRDGVSLHGCDIHAPSIRWLDANLPRASFAANPFRPPTHYGDDAFDLIYAISVFTHLDEATQDAWLAELARIARPGALCLFTVRGPETLKLDRHWVILRGIDPAERERLRDLPVAELGFHFVPYTVPGSNRSHYQGTEEVYGLSFHSPAYIEDRWTEHFDVLEIVPPAPGTFQDIVVLRAR